MEKKKAFEFPKAIIIEFNSEDIIVTSGQFGFGPGEEPGDQHND